MAVPCTKNPCLSVSELSDPASFARPARLLASVHEAHPFGPPRALAYPSQHCIGLDASSAPGPEALGPPSPPLHTTALETHTAI